MGGPPKKRAREDDTSSQTSKAEAAGRPEFDKHPKLWFEDGNIIFIAGRAGLKLHRSIVQRESAVLKDRCEGEGARTEYDGLSSFVLNEDASDAAAMFRGFYGALREEDVPQYTFATISAFLRMGKAYQIARLYKEAETVLLSRYPRNLEQFNIVCKMDPSQRRMKSSKAQAYDAVKLAHQMSLDSVLLAALYKACQFKPEFLFQSRGTLDEPGDTSDNHWVLLHLFLGRAKLAEAKKAQTFCFLDGELRPSYATSRACAAGFLKGLEAYRDRLLHEFATRCDALASVDDAIDKKFGKYVCARCLIHFKSCLNAGTSANVHMA